jgi:hypothetical protein
MLLEELSEHLMKQVRELLPAGQTASGRGEPPAFGVYSVGSGSGWIRPGIRLESQREVVNGFITMRTAQPRPGAPISFNFSEAPAAIEHR